MGSLLNRLTNERCVRYYHYYRPLKLINKAVKRFAKLNDELEFVGHIYVDEDSRPKTTTLAIPLLKKKVFKNGRLSFDRNYFPEHQALHIMEKTMIYSLYEIKECITFLHAILNQMDNEGMIHEKVRKKQKR